MKKIYSIVMIITLVIFTSCNNWLSVSPSIEMPVDEQFSSEQGFEDALSGVYVLMKVSTLYGEQLAFRNIDYMASLWETSSATAEESFALHQYDKVTGTIDGMYGKLYNVIANINNILEYLELKKDVFKTPGEYEIIKGECLALRAFLHFDLIRLFGPVPSDLEAGGAKLSYVTVLSKEINLPVSFEKYGQQLLEDVREAQRLLKPYDPILNYSIQDLRNPSVFGKIPDMNPFYANRTIRFNYYASKALEARICIWYGETEDAYHAAMEVINATNDNGTRKFDINSITSSFATNDMVLLNEQVCGLYDYDLPKKYTTSFATGVLYNGINNQKIIKTLFGTTGTDSRELNLWELKTLPNGNRFTTKKYDVSTSNRQIPLIRLSELYLIAIETGESRETQNLWDEYLSSRRLVNKSLPTEMSELQKEILTEFRKEFYAEGQLFYLYKRYNSPQSDILFANPTLKANYILPLPKTELSK